MPGQLARIARWFDRLERIDRRLIYLTVFLSILIPVFVIKTASDPVEFKTAKMFYDTVEALQSRDDQIVFMAIDWSPSVVGENGPQTELAMEHLMRKRVKFVMIAGGADAEPFLLNYPKMVADRLHKKTGETWEYGKDWVNLGYKPAAGQLMLQIVKGADIRKTYQVDYQGTPLTDIPCMKNITSFNQIPMLVEITSWFGALQWWIQFFQSETHRPVIAQGSGSYMIVDVYNYIDSKQIAGLLEGVSGAAYYGKLLGYTKKDPTTAMTYLAGLSLAQVMIIFFVVIGNVGMALRAYHARSEKNAK